MSSNPFSVQIDPLEAYKELSGKNRDSDLERRRWQEHDNRMQQENFNKRLAYDKQTRELNYQRGKEFAMNDLKWKVQAARDMGISPLALGGMPTHSGPTHISGVDGISPAPPQQGRNSPQAVGIQLAINADKREQEKHDKEMDDIDKQIEEAEDEAFYQGLKAKSAYIPYDFDATKFNLPENVQILFKQEVAEALDNMAARIGAVGGSMKARRQTKFGPPGPWDDIPIPEAKLKRHGSSKKRGRTKKYDTPKFKSRGSRGRNRR